MTETTVEQPTVEDAGSVELDRVRVWEARYRLGDDPEELAHQIG